MSRRVSNVRIVAGRFKGLKIPFKASKYIRPTTNKTKETIFSWLKNDLKNSNCLDMFAGTGSLGIEAISRGASFVYFIEKNKKMYEQLCKTTIKLDIQKQCEIMVADVLKFPLEKKIKQPLDIIFIDPPFRLNYLKKAFFIINSKKLITKESIICTEVEKEKELKEILLEWKMIKSKISGQSRYCLLKKK
ncbi:MAG: 16S rRNA (guanine(966)-N(2))-methyltransferase RsmD [Pseudomonadota bacterium]|nr:16S rRNA (guanine(966)-N(2))-methyltransferase RsmD [Pseudomonadota bacterium]